MPKSHQISTSELNTPRKLELTQGISSRGEIKRLILITNPVRDTRIFEITVGNAVVASEAMALSTAVEIYNQEAPF